MSCTTRSVTAFERNPQERTSASARFSTATLAWGSFSRTARRRGFVGLRHVHVEGPVRARVRGRVGHTNDWRNGSGWPRGIPPGRRDPSGLAGRGHLLPVEVKPGVFRAIRAAASKGIIVIEAAGNQGRPLEDALEHPRRAAAWTDSKTRRSDVPRDCRIPARSSWAAARSRQIGARYDRPVQDRNTRAGPRVDCCAWSRDVWTSHGEPSDYDFFNGTSAAAVGHRRPRIAPSNSAQRSTGETTDSPRDARVVSRSHMWD